MKGRNRTLSGRGGSVREDWLAWMPEVKTQVFESHIRQLESQYSMFSVSLNAAMELRDDGRMGNSLEALAMASQLCVLLTDPLAGLLRALYDHVKHHGTVPNAAPLDPGNYKGCRSQHLARVSGMLHRVLLSHRLQFLHKITTLQEIVEDVGREFGKAACELVAGTSITPRELWAQVDAAHYDINTSLREAVVLLKSFLMVLPQSQLAAFQKTVNSQWQLEKADSLTPHPVVRPRRMATFAGE